MNKPPSCRRSSRPRRARAAAVITVIATTAALTAACGGTSSAAGAGGTPTPAPAGNTGRPTGSQLLAYSRCMRSHGVPGFPDPGSAGDISKEAIVSAAHAVGDARFRTASSACQSLLPGGQLGQRNTITAQDQQDYLKAVACVRAHGFTSIPDPVFSSGSVRISVPSSVNTSSPQFVQAVHTCEKLIPSGLPYSGSGEGS